MKHIFALLLSVSCAAGWQYFTNLQHYTLYSSIMPKKSIHSEYFFGDCKKAGIKFYTHIYLDHLSVLGKVIVRGWIDIPRIPTCIYLRANSEASEMFVYTTYNFQFCIPRLTYTHNGLRRKYFYYEWYIPSDFAGGMDWDIFFFGPSELKFQ